MIEQIRTAAELHALNMALLDAVNSAAMVENTEDGGTCNLDCVTLKISMPKKIAAAAWVRLDKMLVSDWGRLWRGYYLVDIPLSGQGNRRTRMAEAARDALKAKGYDAAVYYQCD